jgi:2',3'-cyclic-nucleotide 2'-phosphodiesterase (5'-nucleotidase family)
MRWTRLTFLLVGLLAGLAAAQERLRSLTLLHVNDLHARLLPDTDGKGGFAYLAGAIRREKAGCADCLVLNAGDLVQGSPVSTIFRGLPVYQLGNLFGFDVATLGNHEFDYGWGMVPQFISAARYPVVAANVADREGRLLASKGYVIREVNGIRVAVIGLLMGDLARFVMPGDLGEWRALPVIEVLRKQVAEVRGRADMIVALAHIGETEVAEILHDAPEVAVVVSGHNHKGLEQAEEFGGRLHVRVNGYGRELGRLDLRVNVPAGKVEWWKWRRIAIEAGKVAPAEDMAAQVSYWERQVSARVDVPVGESRQEISGQDLRTLLERAVEQSLGIDFSFLNAGVVRDRLPKGRLLARHIWNIIPFDDRILIGKIPGIRLPEVVTRGRHIEPERSYTLAVTDFTAANQASKSQLDTHGLEFPETGPLLRDLVIEWVRKKQVVP